MVDRSSVPGHYIIELTDEQIAKLELIKLSYGTDSLETILYLQSIVDENMPTIIALEEKNDATIH